MWVWIISVDCGAYMDFVVRIRTWVFLRYPLYGILLDDAFSTHTELIFWFRGIG